MLIHQNKVVTIRFRAETGILKALWNMTDESKSEAIARALLLLRDSIQSFPVSGLLISFPETGFPAAELVSLIKEQSQIAAAKSPSLKVGISVNGSSKSEMGKIFTTPEITGLPTPENTRQLFTTEEEAQEWLTGELCSKVGR